MKSFSRRVFLKTATAGTLALTGSTFSSPEKPPVDPTSARLPLWRGFNLLEKFTARKEGNPPFQPFDFQLMEDWGFDFARLPMSYHCWSRPDPEQWLKMDERQLAHIDQAIELGRKHGVHINLNFHRAPGYCVNPPAEPLDLWSDQRALDAASHHWSVFAKRYQGIPNRELSFDLLNEPPDIPAETYARVAKQLAAAIRAEDSSRLIIADGLRWGREPMPELVETHLAQSTRGYDPMRISHHKASWVKGSDQWPEPTWPLQEGKQLWDKARLRRERIEPWKRLEEKGVGVHVGEWGAYNKTPHPVALAWMRDQLELWQEAGWGWALWNLRGSFGLLDSDRGDVSYVDFHGHKLDQQMLRLLQAF